MEEFRSPGKLVLISVVGHCSLVYTVMIVTCTYIETVTDNITVEPPNKGHIGTFRLSLVERLSSSRRSIYTQNVQLVHFCLSFIGGCPYLGGSFIGGSTVINDWANFCISTV